MLIIGRSLLILHLPCLKPDWYWQIKSLSKKEFNNLSNISLSRVISNGISSKMVLQIFRHCFFLRKCSFRMLLMLFFVKQHCLPKQSKVLPFFNYTYTILIFSDKLLTFLVFLWLTVSDSFWTRGNSSHCKLLFCEKRNL